MQHCLIRRLVYAVSWIGALSLMAGDVKAKQEAEFAAQELLKSCVEYRTKGFSDIEVTFVLDKPPSSNAGAVVTRPHQQSRLKISFSQGKIRRELESRRKKSSEWTLWSRPTIAVFDGVSVIEDARANVAVVRRSHNHVPNVFEHYGLFDVRALGMTFGGITDLDEFGMQSIVGQPFLRYKRSAEVNLDGRPTTQIEYEHTNDPGVEYSVWIDAGKGPSIVRTEMRRLSPSGAEEINVSNEIALQKWEPRNLWFPKTIVHVVRTSGTGGVPVSADVQAVKWIDGDDSRFGVIGLQLAEGRHVFDDTSGTTQQFVWQDNQLKEYVPESAHVAEVLEQNDSTKWMLIINGAIVVVLGILIFLRSRKKQL